MARAGTASEDPVRKGGVIGQYQLVKEIGVGGMASVWRAEHTRLGKPVAVKFLTLGLGVKQRRDRFLREAKIVASLKHRNVVGIVDYGDLPDGRAYMVLDLLDGESLHERLARKPRMTTEEVVKVSLETLAGLAAAHAAGVVHRDVKPSNIFLAKEEDGMHAKLLDFGISISSDAETSGPTVTQTGAIVGTPEYMSPEQGRSSKEIDVRTDVWSMGVVMYEALTATKPFAAENFGDILIAVTTKDVPPPQQIVKGLDPRIGAVVARAMTRDAAQRWKSAAEMRTALLEATTTEARASTPAVAARGKAPAASASPSPSPSPTMTRRRGEGVVRPKTGRWIALGVVTLLALAGVSAWVFFPDELSALYTQLTAGDEAEDATDTPATNDATHRRVWHPAKHPATKRAPTKRPTTKRNPR